VVHTKLEELMISSNTTYKQAVFIGDRDRPNSRVSYRSSGTHSFDAEPTTSFIHAHQSQMCGPRHDGLLTIPIMLVTWTSGSSASRFVTPFYTPQDPKQNVGECGTFNMVGHFVERRLG
jgi:hypothetical protein